jgi:hypothetical protein
MPYEFKPIRWVEYKSVSGESRAMFETRMWRIRVEGCKWSISEIDVEGFWESDSGECKSYSEAKIAAEKSFQETIAEHLEEVK